jgi:hypothetical protein
MKIAHIDEEEDKNSNEHIKSDPGFVVPKRIAK